LEQNGARLRYSGAAALAESLRVERLHGSPIYLPSGVVVGRLGKFKAALYAAWHAGRGQADERRPRPISRATLAAKSGVSARTLQRYDQRAGVERQRHMAVGGRYNEKAAQEHAWQRGRAAFTFTDYQGRQGRAGGVYLAHNLPNSYEANLSRAARGRQRKINRRLNQPRDSVARGAGAARIFHSGGAAASQAYNRQPDRDAYWPMHQARGDGRVWAIIPALNGGWRLIADGWRLIADGWRLIADCWPLTAENFCPGLLWLLADFALAGRIRIIDLTHG
jgi:hypothetical protein